MDRDHRKKQITFMFVFSQCKRTFKVLFFQQIRFCSFTITTRMHSSRMRTARSSGRPGGLHQAPPRDQAPPPSRPPGTRHTPPPVNRMTNRCKNITLPQTSFAGGNKLCTTVSTERVCEIYVSLRLAPRRSRNAAINLRRFSIWIPVRGDLPFKANLIPVFTY